MSDQNQAADALALCAWDIIADYRNDPASVTDEVKGRLRTGAFRFSRSLKSSDDWQVSYGRALAAAVIAWVTDDSPETFKALERASRRYEEQRISPH